MGYNLSDLLIKYNNLEKNHNSKLEINKQTKKCIKYI